MPTGQQYATNVPQTALVGSIGTGTTSITVASASGWPTVPFTAVLDLGNSNQEPVDVTSTGGGSTTWTITRAVDSTTAFVHSGGASITHCDIGRDFREARTHIDASSGQHGITGSFVGTSDTQTLTNKTLTQPIISGSGGTLSLPAGPDTLAGIATSQTLTNKTLTSPTINGAILTGTQTATSATFQDITAQNSGNAAVPFVINALTGTSGDIMEIKKNGTQFWNVNANGRLIAAAGTVIQLDNSTQKPLVGPLLQSYTPTLSGTGATVGNGTISGGFVQYGTQTFFEIYLIFGSTTSFATSGFTSLTLPISASNYVKADGFFVAANNNVYQIMGDPGGLSSGGGSFVMHLCGTGGGGALSGINSTTPSSQGSSSVLYLRGVYQATG